MMSTDIISDILATLVFAACVYFLIRNHLVYRFKMRSIDAAYNAVAGFIDSLETDSEFLFRFGEYKALDRLKNNVYDVSYTRLLFSFKPLKLRYWFTPEEIEFLKKGGME